MLNDHESGSTFGVIYRYKHRRDFWINDSGVQSSLRGPD